MIPFTQYLRPNGEKRSESIEREAMASRIIEYGGRFEVEELSTGKISLTCAWPPLNFDIAHEICDNGTPVLAAVDKLVLEAHRFMQDLDRPLAKVLC